MHNRTGVILHKELLTLVRDRRLVISVALVSLLVMPTLMGVLGNIDRLTGAADKPVDVLVETADPVLERVLKARTDVRLHRSRAEAAASAKHFLVIEAGDREYRVLSNGANRQVRARARSLVTDLEREREVQLAAALDGRGLRLDELQPFAVTAVDSADASFKAARQLGLLVPYLAIILLVGNAARASFIAVGEKEKKTLASLLVANVDRRSIVHGKMLAIVAFTVGSSLLLVTGLLLFARLGFSLVPVDSGAQLALGWLQVGQLLVNIIALALFISAVIMLIGTIARSQREAGMYTAPLVFVSVVLAVLSFSSSEFGVAAYATPILGSALAMKDTFFATLQAPRLLVALGADLVLAGLLVALSARLYEREAIMFPE